MNAFIESHPELTPVPVIASFAPDGSMMPLYFKYTFDPEEGAERIHVDRVLWTNAERDSLWFGVECSGGTVTLLYEPRFHAWFFDTKGRTGWGFS